jgi:hypothetical protein
VVRDDHVGDQVGRKAGRRQRLQDHSLGGDHARVDDYDPRWVDHEADRGGDAVSGGAGMEDLPAKRAR